MPVLDDVRQCCLETDFGEMGPALVDHVDDLATTFDTVNANALPSQRHRERETDIAQADNQHRGRLLCRHSRYSILLYTMRVAEASSAAARIRQRPFGPDRKSVVMGKKG